MNAREKIRALLVTLATDLFGSDNRIIYAYENGPRPDRPYVAIHTATVNQMPVHKGRTTDEGDDLMSVHEDFNVELHIYDQDPMTIASIVAMRFQRETSFQKQEELDMALRDELRVDYVPELRDDSTQEPRAIVRLSCGHTLHDSDAVGVIEEVHIIGTAVGLLETEVQITASVAGE